ncbi:MAG: alpha/beta hydrolase, partial [Myxococcota bacterium]|nr:alpha/beta hydrolase [Myxococcota bacterium]
MTRQSKPAARSLRRVGLLACLAVAGLNAIAYAHARSFLYFSSDGPRTGPPEHLGAVARAKVALTGVELPRPLYHRTPADVGLPFETAFVRASDGTRLEAWWVPADGPPRGRALLFHGYGGSKDELLDIAAWWHERGWAVGLVDFRGGGGSDGVRTPRGWEESLDVLAMQEEAGRRGEEPIVLYGFSMGAAAIAGAIGRHGLRPDGVVLEA